MKISVSEFFDILDVDSENVGEITLTKTMLDKCIIDANLSVVKFAESLGEIEVQYWQGQKNAPPVNVNFCDGVHYSLIGNGHRVMIDGKHLITTDEGICETVTVRSNKWTEDNCRIVFYKTARGDKRISISGLKKYAQVGDKVALTFGSNGCLIINISRAFGGASNG
tara:strand:- start:390 stop:890 length:501 start_codon:yes stop_codon:yes gene_type:complete